MYRVSRKLQSELSVHSNAHTPPSSEMQRAPLGHWLSVSQIVVQKPFGHDGPSRHFCAQSVFRLHSAPSFDDTLEL